jgi:capsid protein
MVDPSVEVPAAIDAVRGGLSTRSEENRRLGFDPEEIEREASEENQRVDDLKNVRFDSDGRYPKATRGSELVSTPVKPGGVPAPTPGGGKK